MSDPRSEERETERAASEAARIGGDGGRLSADPTVDDAGGGEAEGFEQAEKLLVEHASPGDSQSAHAILHDQTRSEEDDERADGESDHERSSETDTDSSGQM
jgi:hypothetical protein